MTIDTLIASPEACSGFANRLAAQWHKENEGRDIVSLHFEKDKGRVIVNAAQPESFIKFSDFCETRGLEIVEGRALKIASPHLLASSDLGVKWFEATSKIELKIEGCVAGVTKRELVAAIRQHPSIPEGASIQIKKISE